MGLYRPEAERPHAQVVREYATLDFDSLDDIVGAFLDETGAGDIEAVCVGVAGPVTGMVARLTNVPWLADLSVVADRFDGRPAQLLNDLEAMAYAVPVLEPDETGGAAGRHRRADGECGAHRRGHRPRRSAAPQRQRPVSAVGVGRRARRLRRADAARARARRGALQDLRARRQRARDFRTRPREPVSLHARRAARRRGMPRRSTRGWIRRSCRPRSARARSRAAARSARKRSTCSSTAYGSEAGNLALRSVATAGVYIGGGIAPKILPALEHGPFLEAFCDKEPMVDLLRTLPVSIILNPAAGLVGAAVRAASLSISD